MDSEKIKEQLKEITKQLEKGIKEVFESDKYKIYLNTMSKFYNYSFNNTMLIAMQKPDATLIAGYHAWQNKFKRHVNKGEKAIRIIAPAPIKITEEREKLDAVTQEPILDEKNQPVYEKVEVSIPQYKVLPVFDISQTKGEPLPELGVEALIGEVKDYPTLMKALMEVSPVPIGYEEIQDGAKGYFDLDENRIAIQSGMSEMQTLKTAIHEISHAKLHTISQKQKIDRKTKEVEAESIAYTVCKHYGIDTSEYSFGYIAGWSSGKEMSELRSSLETIRKIAGEFISQIEERLQELHQTVEQDKTEISLVLADEEIHVYTYPYKVIAVDIEEMGGDRTAIFKTEKDIPDSEIASIHTAFYGMDFELEIEEVFGVEWIESIDYEDGTIITRESVVSQKVNESEADNSIMKRTEHYIDELESEKTIFTGKERNLIVNYAYKTGNFEQAKDVADVLAFQLAYSSNLVAQTVIRIQDEMESFPDGMIGILEMHDYGYLGEEMLPLTKERAKQLWEQDITIYQLHVDDTETLIENVEELERHEGIFGVEKEQWERYWDKKEEAVYEFADRYLEIHQCDDGYDYTFYDKHYIEIDGGVYDNPDITLQEAVYDILTDDPFENMERKVLDYESFIEKVDTAGDYVLQESLNHRSNMEIQETVLAYAQSKVDEIGADIVIKQAKVYGSRSKGMENENSDVDVVLSYSGDMKEDALFNLLHEDGLTIEGMLVDINPISEEKTGSIEAYLATANEYLDKKEKLLKEKSDLGEEASESISFYVAECMEFTSLGEYQDNLTLEEAIGVYEAIPAERLSGIKGIGFKLHNNLEPRTIFADMEFELFSGNTIDLDTINHIKAFESSELVQQAIRDIIEKFPDATVWDRDTKKAKEEKKSILDSLKEKKEQSVKQEAKIGKREELRME